VKSLDLLFEVYAATLPEPQKRALRLAKDLNEQLGNEVSGALIDIATGSGDADAIEALVAEIRAAVVKARNRQITPERFAAMMAELNPPPPTDTFIANPNTVGCGSPFCRDCGAKSGARS
jgi:hypothetical protein